jgi:hypothetical protein
MNPRNNAAVNTENTSVKKPVTEWGYLSLGSMAITDGKDKIRKGQASFTINAYNAQLLKDACEFVLNNPVDDEGKPSRVSLTAYPFFDSVSGKKADRFTHDVKLSRDTISKFGKLEDYVTIKS